MPETQQNPQSEIIDLNKRKRILKGQLTRFENFLRDIDNHTDKTHIEIRLKKCETLFDEFETIQTRIEMIDENEEDTRGELETRFIDGIAKAKNLLTTTNTDIVTNVEDSTTSVLTQLLNRLSVGSTNNVKLPSIQLPSYDGTYQNWGTFHDTFLRLIHDNSKLTNVEKLHHLKSCLKDVALKVIANLEITDDNYDIAWQLLVERFENKRVIINNHIKALLNLPKVGKSSSVLLRELTDNIHMHVSALQKLGLEIKGWEWILNCIISSKLDNATDLAWEDTLEPNSLPTYDQFKKFLTKRCFSLENTASNNSNNLSQPKASPTTSRSYSKPFASTYTVTEQTSHTKCHYCQQNHFIYKCPQFCQLSVDEKYNQVRNFKLCNNCLRPGHSKQYCRSSGCKKCHRNHNTLLHNNNYNNRQVNPQTSNPPSSANISESELSANRVNNGASGLFNSRSQVNVNNQLTNNRNHIEETSQILQSTNIPRPSNNSLVLLSTAQILIHDKFGNVHVCRALLDSGSQSNLISQDLCNKLLLDKEDIHIPIAGINQAKTIITHRVQTVIKSRTTHFIANLSCLVIPKITDKIPGIDFDISSINYDENISLADPEFNKTQEIDLLLGASLFYELLCPKQIKLGKNKLILQETMLGWIFTGTIYYSNKNFGNTSGCHFSRQLDNESLNKSLVKFWQVEELPEKRYLSADEQRAEDYYQQTTTRDINGRFIVRLPFKEQLDNFGNSQVPAFKRFQSLEYKFTKNAALKESYVHFMNEYKMLNHMSLISEFNVTIPLEQPSFILPHHAVIKESSSTTKCRVVFDGSAKTNLGTSLNDKLLIGYTIQDDLFSIITRLRLRKYVLIADLKMMFRQIMIHPDDRKYQQILWRSDGGELQLFSLNTVTYGTACAPFIATRSLHELALLYEEKYPRTCNIIKTSFYMDDLLVSLDSIEEALDVYSEITEILGSARFYLRKWSSNEPRILAKILGSDNNSDNLIEIHENEQAKTLGIAWKIDEDALKYSINFNIHDTVSKRQVLSSISKIYDPLGLIGATTIRLKLFMKHLWKQGVEWDEPLSDELRQWWIEFINQTKVLNDIKISRQVLCNEPQTIEMHGFCDASERAYGTCIYLVSIDKFGKRYSNLLCAKSKVAPQSICTLPRLELLAAVLLSRLSATVEKILDIEISRKTFYSDSMIVLSWLRIDPSQLKTFVANRVAKINELTDINNWKHVSSKDNAADIISRGVSPQELINSVLWWYGPQFLNDNFATNPTSQLSDLDLIEDSPERKEIVRTLLSTENPFDIFGKFSSLFKLQRVISYCLRFKFRVINKLKIDSNILTNEEMQYALLVLLKLAQAEVFSEEINCLKSRKMLKSTSKILCLNPFLDKDNLLRVGGRLKNSDIEYSQKHPIILPKGHKLTHLILVNEHLKNLHTGTQNLLAIIRLKYWPIGGKSAVKNIIRKCITCFKVNPQPSPFLMGELPKARVTPSRPFSHCGLDYCGPVLIKDGTLRNAKKVKTYICIFVCFATRAVHFELVKDLTTDSFLNALKRFISRRGKPYEIFSDNATNFIGARNHFKELYNLLTSGNHENRVSNYLSSDKISWKMIPARSPHMGGNWESYVKSLKFHLRRVVGNAFLTYEEFYTILTQIEACLNSRPLFPLSCDPNDYSPLTPAHFLIGDSLAAIPQEDVQHLQSTRLSRYHLMQQVVQHFWNRWSREYLSTLQSRSKWRVNSSSQPKVGDLVILMEDNSPPLRWPMGRITELHPGRDNIVRVVSIKTVCGTITKRSLAKICFLPTEDNV